MICLALKGTIATLSLVLLMAKACRSMTDIVSNNAWIAAGIQRMQSALGARPCGAEEETNGSELTPYFLTDAHFSALGIQKRHFELLRHAEERLATTSLRAAADFVADQDAWCLLLSGDSGVGKTFAAEWALAEILRHSGPVVGLLRRQQVFTVPALRRAWFDEKIMSALSSAQALLLDDLGSEPIDQLGFTGASLFEVVNTRWGRGSKTILTTNMTPASFKSRYGQKITDRLTQGGKAVVVLGETLRSRGKKDVSREY
jgi:DNA replication protein DnaC